MQQAVSPISTILKLGTSCGWLYLKAPAFGNNEFSITKAVHTLFPDSICDVIGVNHKLNAFVSKEFDDDEEPHFREVVIEMAQLQMDSVEHLDKLTAAGCKTLSLEVISKRIEDWLSDKDFEQAFGGHIESFRESSAKLQDLCSQLIGCRVPLTLVHGDLGLRNAAKSETEEKFILFDWQYACISHPFFDLHEVRHELDPIIVDECLSLWEKYADREEIDKAHQITAVLGWMPKLWSMIECLKHSYPERNSSLAAFARDRFHYMKREIEEFELD